MKKNRYHCCATCVHFRAKKESRPVSYSCERLGYETRPHYVFDCWSPREKITARMKKNEQTDK